MHNKIDLRFNKKTIVLILFLMFLAFHLFSQTEISDSLVIERIQNIQKMLKHGKRNADLWNYGWLTAYSAGTAVQGVVYFTADEKSIKQDMALGSTTSLLGALFQIIDPLEVGKKAKTLANIPESTPEERYEKLSICEETFKELASREKAGKSWKTHALCGAVNIGSGLITWIGFRRTFWDGVVNFALNSAISEVQIWTQPTQTMKDYQDYCQKYNTELSVINHKPKPSYYLGASPGGISFRMVF